MCGRRKVHGSGMRVVELEEKGIRWDIRRKVSGSGMKDKVRGKKEVSMTWG